MKEQINECINRKYPEWIILISSIDSQGRPDIMPAGWGMFTSNEPRLFAISVGHSRYTHQAIEQTGEFVIGIPSAGMGEDINITGSLSGPEKLKKTKFMLSPAKEVKPFLIDGCVANYECKLQNKLVTGDHTIFVGEIVRGHVGGDPGTRLMNFGFGTYAVAKEDPNTIYRAK